MESLYPPTPLPPGVAESGQVPIDSFPSPSSALASSITAASIRLLHHGAAASSRPRSLLWISSSSSSSSSSLSGSRCNTPESIPRNGFRNVESCHGDRNSGDELIFPSHSVINIARKAEVRGGGVVMSVTETLRPSIGGGVGRSVTALSKLRRWVVPLGCKDVEVDEDEGSTDTTTEAVAASFSDGSLSVWSRSRSRSLRERSKRGCAEEEEEKFENREAPETEESETVTELVARGSGWVEEVVIPPPGVEGSNGGGGGDGGGNGGGGGGGGEEGGKRRNGDSSSADPSSSITDVAGAVILPWGGTVLLTASHDGVRLLCHRSSSRRPGGEKGTTSCQKIANFAAASVEATILFHTSSNDDDAVSRSGEQPLLLVAVGTAGPRHNRVHIYTIRVVVRGGGKGGKEGEENVNADVDVDMEYRHHGALSGHSDWVSCLDFLSLGEGGGKGKGKGMLLASGGRDARVRLWRFRSPRVDADAKADLALDDDEAIKSSGPDDDGKKDDDGGGDGGDDDDDGEDGAREDDDDYDEEEARMHVRYSNGGRGTCSPVTLEALLVGHDEAVTSVLWRPGGRFGKTGDEAVVPTLLTSSMDRSILLWRAEEGGGGRAGRGRDVTMEKGENDHDDDNDERGVWVPIVRLGSAGGILGGPVGSSLIGYVGAAFDPSGTVVVGHGYGGSLHFWGCERFGAGSGTGEEEEDATERWTARPPLTGHFRGVSDISWEATGGEYLLSAGSDQTCRLWAEVPLEPHRFGGEEDKEEEEEKEKNQDEGAATVWREVGRPQVHGYDMTAVCCIGGNEGGEPPHRYVSASDEKEIRAFDAPRATLRLLQRLRERVENLAGIDEETGAGAGAWGGGLERVERAYLPSLGLSNRATAADALEEEDEFHRANGAAPFASSRNSGENAAKGADERSVFACLPSERDLGVASLWPEVRKLFGHDTEVVCLASTSSTAAAFGEGRTAVGRAIVASSAKARGVDDAAIRLWDVEQNKCLDVLKGGHRSTVAAMCFSPDGRFLASSGKDRRMCIWRQRSGSELDGRAAEAPSYTLAAAADSAHRRIVWSVDFCPFRPIEGDAAKQQQSYFLASGARDGAVKVWEVQDNSNANDVHLVEVYKFEPASAIGACKAEAVTAVAFAPVALPPSSGVVLAIGTESGRIGIWSVALPVAGAAATAAASSSTFCSRLLLVPPNFCHSESVRKLAWRPEKCHAGENGAIREEHCLTLASCGMDYGIRIFGLKVQVEPRMR